MSDPDAAPGGGDGEAAPSPTARPKPRSAGVRRTASLSPPMVPMSQTTPAAGDKEYPVTTAEGSDRLLAKFYEGTSGPMASPEGEKARRKVSLRHPDERPADAAVDELPLQQRVRARHSLASLRGIVSNLPALPEASDVTLNKIDLGSADGKAWVRKVLKLYDGRVTALERELLDLIEVAGEAAELRRQVAAEKEKAKEMDHAMQSLMPLNFLNQEHKTEVGPAMAKITEDELAAMRADYDKSRKEVVQMRFRMKLLETQAAQSEDNQAKLGLQLAQAERDIEALKGVKDKAVEEADVLTEKMQSFEQRVKHECELEMERYKKVMSEMRTKNRGLAETNKELQGDNKKTLGELEAATNKALEMETEHARALQERDDAVISMKKRDTDQMAALDAIWSQLQKARLPDAFSHLFPELAAPAKSPSAKLKKRVSVVAAVRARQSFSKKRSKSDAGPVFQEAKDDLRDEKREETPAPAPAVLRDESGLSAMDYAENEKFRTADKPTRAGMISACIAHLFLQNKQRGDALEVVEKDAVAKGEQCEALEQQYRVLEEEAVKLRAAVKALKKGPAQKAVGTQTVGVVPPVSPLEATPGFDGQPQRAGQLEKLDKLATSQGRSDMGTPPPPKLLDDPRTSMIAMAMSTVVFSSGGVARSDSIVRVESPAVSPKPSSLASTSPRPSLRAVGLEASPRRQTSCPPISGPRHSVSGSPARGLVGLRSMGA